MKISPFILKKNDETCDCPGWKSAVESYIAQHMRSDYSGTIKTAT